MKKGFTIVELLLTIAIIAIIGGISVIAYSSIFDTTNTNYYKTVENSLELSGTEYFQKNRDELPIKGYNVVSLENLEQGNYISPLKDSKGNSCERGDVYVTRDLETKNYNYTVCLKCDNYESDNMMCRGNIPGSINISSHLESNNKSYNPLLSYKNVGIVFDDNVIVDLSLDDANLSYFKIDKVNDHINKGESVIIENSGSYLVSAYNNENKKISDDRIINVKIDRDKPTFKIINEKRYTINDTDTTINIPIKLEEVKDNFGIGKVEYCIYKDNENCSYVNLDISNGKYVINKDIGSGKYQVKVKMYDLIVNKLSGYSDTVINRHLFEEESSFDVSYFAKLKYTSTDIQNFEVIKGEKYGYLDTLPSSYNNKLIKWSYEGENTKVTNDTDVVKDKSHILVSEYTDKVSVTTGTYCNQNLVYNGKGQKLTKDEPLGVQFVNNIGTNAGEYTITAKVLPGYVWDDGTTANKNFKCSIGKKEIIVTAENKTMLHTGTSPVYTYSITGEVYNPSDISGTAQYTIKKGSTTISNISTADVGKYSIIPGGLTVSGNYKISYKNGNLTIGTVGIGNVYYVSIAEALLDVPVNNSVTLVEVYENITEDNITIDKNKNVKLKLRNHTVTNNNKTGSFITNNGTLSFDGGGIINTLYTTVTNNGTLNITSITMNCSGTNDTIINNAKATFKMSSGALNNTSGYSTENFVVKNYGNATISGGNITSSKSRGVSCRNSGNVTISGGTIKSYAIALVVEGNSDATVTVTGGTFWRTDNGPQFPLIQIDKGKLHLKGGTYKRSVSGHLIYNTGYLKLYSGLNITGTTDYPLIYTKGTFVNGGATVINYGAGYSVQYG